MLSLSNSMTTPAALCALAGLTGLAQAEGPAVMDYVPADAVAVVTIANLNELLADITRVNTALGEQGNPMLPMMMGMAGAIPGMDMNGSMAIVVNTTDFENMDPNSVAVVLPVADFDGMVQALQGQMTEDLIANVSMQGQQVAVKSLGGGFAVAGASADAVRNYAGAAGGQMAGNEARLGANGTEALAGSDISITVNLQALRPLVQPMIDEQMAGAQEMVQMMPEAQMAAAPMEAAAEAFAKFMNDASTAVIAISADEAGIGMNFAAQFAAESETAGFFTARSDSSAMLNHVPDGPFLYASAFDLDWPGFDFAIDGLVAMIDGVAEQQPELQEVFAAFDLKALMDNTTGFAQVVNVNPEGMMSGLLKQSATYMAGKDPAALLDMQKQGSLMAGGFGGQGMDVGVDYQENAITIEGVELDAYTTSFTMDPNGGMNMGAANPAMMMQMMYGADMGPQGYMAAMENALIQTTTQDAAYVAKTITAARDGNGLGKSAALAKVSDRLPSGRFMEVYLGSEDLLNSLMPMAAMFGVVDNFEPVADVAPIGFGMSGHSGGATFGMFIPLELVSVGAKMAPNNDPMMQPMDADEDPEF